MSGPRRYCWTDRQTTIHVKRARVQMPTGCLGF